MRVREMMQIRGRAIAGDFPQDFRAPFLGGVERFERQHGRALTKR